MRQAAPGGHLPAVPDSALAGLLRAGTPLLDLRAPVEFAQGAPPAAVNLPLMSDDERHRVGLCYRQHGQEKAIALGHRLVSGPVREQRLAAWLELLQRHPDTVLYCWRGGLRSQTVQQWLADAGQPVPRLAGGWKALRQCILQTLEQAPATLHPVVLGGRTGTGKTRLLVDLPRHLDLEGLARHRGSAFGAMPQPQPTPVAFEAAVAVDLLRLATSSAPLLVEDEGRAIGRLSVPAALHSRMQAAPLLLLEEPLERRVQCILDDYVREPLDRGEALDALHQRLAAALQRIQRRLGGLRHGQVRAALAAACADPDSAREDGAWVALLLEHYYDPMYDHQLAAKQGRVIFSGNAAALRTWWAEQQG